MRRRLALTLLHRLGVTAFWRWWHRHEVTILMVHGVVDTTAGLTWSPLRPPLSPRRLDECLRLLSARYRFVSLDQAVAMITGRAPVQPYSLVLTFDDGYRNQIKHALPIVRRWGASATFFLATGHVESRTPFWFDRLDFALQQVAIDGREIKVGPHVIRLRGGDRPGLQRSYKALRDTAKAVRRGDREMLDELERLAEVLEAESGCRLADIFEEDDGSSLLSWPDVAGAGAEDVTFGSHTVDHIRLALVKLSIAEDQLQRSKAAIEAHTKTLCRYLCYPNGNVSPAVAAVAARCGYVAAVTTEPGLNRVGDDPMLLRRINFPETESAAETLAEVCGLAPALSAVFARIRGRKPDAPEE